MCFHSRENMQESDRNVRRVNCLSNSCCFLVAYVIFVSICSLLGLLIYILLSNKRELPVEI